MRLAEYIFIVIKMFLLNTLAIFFCTCEKYQNKINHIVICNIFHIIYANEVSCTEIVFYPEPALPSNSFS